EGVLCFYIFAEILHLIIRNITLKSKLIKARCKPSPDFSPKLSPDIMLYPLVERACADYLSFLLPSWKHHRKWWLAVLFPFLYGEPIVPQVPIPLVNPDSVNKRQFLRHPISRLYRFRINDF